MKIISTIILILVFMPSYSQSSEETSNQFELLIGVKTRITPIYLKKVPDVIHTGNINTLEQPDKHLSGPGLQLSQRKKIGSTWDMSFTQAVRRDYIYQNIPLESNPPAGFNYYIKKKLIFDLSADASKRIISNKSSLRIFAGIGVCGLNTGFNETRRVYQSSTNYTDITKKKNFIYTSLNSGLGWIKNKFYTEFKIGYCWKNPTLFDTPFIIPEISFQYQLFGTNK